MIYVKDVHQKNLKKKIPDFKSGDTVKVYQKIKEGDKERIQVFQGTVIARKNSGISATFTVRKISFGTGVEKIFPLYSPNIEKIEVVNRGKVARSKLYYLRERVGKKSRVQEKSFSPVTTATTKNDNTTGISVSALETVSVDTSTKPTSALETSSVSPVKKDSALLTSSAETSHQPETDKPKGETVE